MYIYIYIYIHFYGRIPSYFSSLGSLLGAFFHPEALFLYKVGCHETCPFGDNQKAFKMTPNVDKLLRC